MRSGKLVSEATVRSILSVLRVILRDACAQLGLPDPTHRIRMVGGEGEHRTSRETLTSDQTGQLLDAVREYAPAWLPEVALLAFSGRRPSELYALTWSDIDLEAGVVHIRKSVVRGSVAEPKTPRARRRVPMVPELVELLRDKRGDALDTSIAFATIEGGHRTSATLYHLLADVCARAGLPVVAGRGVRRSFITQASEAGLSQTTLRHLVGHSDPRITAVYQNQELETGRELNAAVVARAGAGGSRLAPVAVDAPTASRIRLH